MGYPLKDQIQAVNYARKHWRVSPKTKKATYERFLDKLRTASTTLQALHLQGEKKLLVSKELVDEVKILLSEWNSREGHITPSINRLEKLIKRTE